MMSIWKFEKGIIKIKCLSTVNKTDCKLKKCVNISKTNTMGAKIE